MTVPSESRSDRRIGLLSERRTQAAQVLPKPPVGDALRYLGRQWGALQRYVDAGHLLIDNNNAEQHLRTVAVGKSWLFAGSLEGAHHAALLYSLLQRCRLIGVPPFPYMRDVLLRVAIHPQAQIHQLQPKGWHATFGG